MKTSKVNLILGVLAVGIYCGDAQAAFCARYGYEWNSCATIVNNTKYHLSLNSKWNLGTNAWGLGQPNGDTLNLPPKTIAPGATVTTGSNAFMLYNIHYKLDYELTEVTNATVTRMGRCTIEVDSTYPGYPKGMTLSQSCDLDWVDVVADKDGQESATFIFTTKK